LKSGIQQTAFVLVTNFWWREVEVKSGLKQVENTIRRTFPEATLNGDMLKGNLNFGEQFPLRLGANLENELGKSKIASNTTVRYPDGRTGRGYGINQPSQKGLMDTEKIV